MGDNYKEEG